MAVSLGKNWIWSKTCKRSLANHTPQQEKLQGSAPHGRSLFGRRIGRPLSTQKKETMDRLLPVLSIPEEKLDQAGTLPPSSLFNQDFSDFWLEIGFGYGEHLAALARKNPDNGYLGAEPFINGMAALLTDIENKPCENIRVMMNDAMILARSLGNETLQGIYILNPDPWHKTRHHKRRIVNRSNLDIFYRILQPGGLLILTTDVEPMAEWMVTQASLHPGFQWLAKTSKDWLAPPPDWIATRYETKGAKNAKKMCYLFFQKTDK